MPHKDLLTQSHRDCGSQPLIYVKIDKTISQYFNHLKIVEYLKIKLAYDYPEIVQAKHTNKFKLNKMHYWLLHE